MVKKLKNQNSNVETDEMFKKVGYTSLAASFEFLMGIMLLASLLDGYFHFLEMLSVHDTLRIIWIIGLILLGLTSRYYSHNPDKT